MNRERLFDPDGDDVFERTMGTMSIRYEKSYKHGRGIKRLLCLVIGFVPYCIAIFVYCVVMVLYYEIHWLVLPKEAFLEKFHR